MNPKQVMPIAIITFVIGLPIGILLFASVTHEVGHTLALLFFKIPFTFSLTHVTVQIPVTGIPSIVVGLSGGIGEALMAILSFLLAVHFEKRGKTWFFSMIGFEVAFLPFVFTGIINSVLEGFFRDFYLLVFDKPLYFVVLLISMIIMSAFIVLSWKFKGQIVSKPKMMADDS